MREEHGICSMQHETVPMIRVNGEDEPFAAADIASLLAGKDIEADQRGIAIAVNGMVVPRAEWSGTRLKPGDTIEIVRARQGG